MSENKINLNESILSLTLKDLTSGTLTGIALTLTGHPFDTIKVRLQTQTQQTGRLPSVPLPNTQGLGGVSVNMINPPSPSSSSSSSLKEGISLNISNKSLHNSDVPIYKGGLHGAIMTIRHEGFFALYKGMLSPLSTVPLVSAVVYASYEQARRFFHRRKKTENEELSLNEIMLSGAYSGFCNSFIVSPVELVKSRLQIQYNVNSIGPMHIVRNIISNDGWIGLMRGLMSTIYREIPAYAAQFYFFEKTKLILRSRQPDPQQKLNIFQLLLAGGVGGMGCWFVSYPQDVIKSRLQVVHGPFGSVYKTFLFDGGFFDCGRKILRSDGWIGLWRGFGPCITRAFVANAVGLTTFEWSSQWLKQHD